MALTCNGKAEQLSSERLHRLWYNRLLMNTLSLRLQGGGVYEPLGNESHVGQSLPIQFGEQEMRMRGIGIALIVAGLYFGVDQVQEKIRLDATIAAQKEARAAEVAVDLSKVGKIEFPYRQSAPLSHRQGMFLEVTPQPESLDKAKALLKGLKAEIVIHDKERREIDRALLEPEESRGCGAPPGLVLTTLNHFPDGDYSVTLDVASPALEIHGRKQLLVARYSVCEMNRLRSLITGIIGYGAIVVAGLIAAGMISRYRRAHQSQATR